MTNDRTEKVICQLKNENLMDGKFPSKFPFFVNEKSIRNWIDKIKCKYITHINNILIDHLYDNEHKIKNIFKKMLEL